MGRRSGADHAFQREEGQLRFKIRECYIHKLSYFTRMGEGEEAYLCNLHDIGSYYPLYSGRNSIGRTEGNAVQLLSRSVSKKHAEIEIDFSRHVPKMILHDLGSSNGTFVNDVRIIGNSRNVRFGDAVRFGYDTQTYKILKDVPLPPGCVSSPACPPCTGSN